MITESFSYTVLWAQSDIKWIRQSGEIGKPLEVIYGGEHQSIPSLTRFKVKPGDFVYPVYVSQKGLHIVARLTVTEILPLKTYFANHLKLSTRLLKMNLWDMEDVLEQERPELGHRLPRGCIFEAAIGEGTPMRDDCAVPPDMLERIRYRSKGGERPIKCVKDGLLTNCTSLQGGYYRLTHDSAEEFRARVMEES